MNYTEEQKQNFKMIFKNMIFGDTSIDKQISKVLEVSEDLGISIYAINRFLSGDEMPTYRDLCRLSSFYGISNSYLLNGKNIMFKEALVIEKNFKDLDCIKLNDRIMIETIEGEKISGRFRGMVGSSIERNRMICYKGIRDDEDVTCKGTIDLEFIADIVNLERND
ncbi:TPA: hypothetical protein ACJP9Y_001003 [Streptococcus pyogenes]